MPCFDPRNEPSFIYENDVQPLQRKVKKLEAMLCGILTVLEKSNVYHNTLNQIDFREGGFTRNELDKWWYGHKAEDAARRKREQDRARRELERKERNLQRLARELGFKVTK